MRLACPAPGRAVGPDYGAVDESRRKAVTKTIVTRYARADKALRLLAALRIMHSEYRLRRNNR